MTKNAKLIRRLRGEAAKTGMCTSCRCRARKEGLKPDGTKYKTCESCLARMSLNDRNRNGDLEWDIVSCRFVARKTA